jgi:hypothetical protein
MITEDDQYLGQLYSNKLAVDGWQVIDVIVSPHELFQRYKQMLRKPTLLIVEYFYPETASGNIVKVLNQVLHQNPSQLIVFLTSEAKILTKENFLPVSLQHIPVILKSTHTVEEMVRDLKELVYYYC